MKAGSVFAGLFLAVSAWAADANKIDPVLLQLVPNDSTSLFGARMGELKTTPLYQKLVAQKSCRSSTILPS